VSTAMIAPPARVIAEVTLPNTPPGLLGSATRSVSENCADGLGRESMIRVVLRGYELSARAAGSRRYG